MKIKKSDIIGIAGMLIAVFSIYKLLSEHSIFWFYASLVGDFMMAYMVGCGMSNFIIALEKYNDAIKKFNQ